MNGVLLLSLLQKHGRRKNRNRITPVAGPGVEFSGRVARQVASNVRSELALMETGSGGVQLVHMWPVQVRGLISDVISDQSDCRELHNFYSRLKQVANVMS